MSAMKLDFTNDSIDCISISFGLRNVVNRETAINEFSRVLKSSESFISLSFSYQLEALWHLFLISISENYYQV